MRSPQYERVAAWLFAAAAAQCSHCRECPGGGGPSSSRRTTARAAPGSPTKRCNNETLDRGGSATSDDCAQTKRVITPRLPLTRAMSAASHQQLCLLRRIGSW